MTVTIRQNTETFTLTKDGEHDATLRLTITGDLDTLNADILTALVANTVDQQHPYVIIVDLTAVTFLDAAGVRALLIAHRIAHGSHAILHAIGARDFVATVLHLSQADTILTAADRPALTEAQPPHRSPDRRAERN
jgi:anti-anti-sigma factor